MIANTWLHLSLQSVFKPIVKSLNRENLLLRDVDIVATVSEDKYNVQYCLKNTSFSRFQSITSKQYHNAKFLLSCF